MMGHIDEETLVRDFLLILKRPLQNYWKIWNKCFLSTTWTVVLSTGSNIQSPAGHTYTKRTNGTPVVISRIIISV